MKTNANITFIDSRYQADAREVAVTLIGCYLMLSVGRLFVTD